MGTWHDETGRHTDHQADLHEEGEGIEDELGGTCPERAYPVQARLPDLPRSFGPGENAPQDLPAEGRRHELGRRRTLPQGT